MHLLILSFYMDLLSFPVERYKHQLVIMTVIMCCDNIDHVGGWSRQILNSVYA